ncbi:MAG: hypothetical protein LLF92_03475 [Planctomycetaceae bacterium]|nr:hypothetical protein [Planctomycetaceae bacterium]
MMKKKIPYKLYLMFLTVFISTGMCETLLWKVDFENGFTPAVGGGTVDIVGQGTYVNILYDNDLQSNVVQVGLPGVTGSPACRLSYTNIDSSIFGKRGKVTLKFKIDTSLETQTNTAFVSANPGTGSIYYPYWWMAFATTPDIVTGDPVYDYPLTTTCQITGDPYSGARYYPPSAGIYPPQPSGEPALQDRLPYGITAGWHTFELIWAQVEEGDPNVWGVPRTRADLRISIDTDPNLVLEYKNALWHPPGLFTLLNIGCQWLGSGSATYQAGLSNRFIDDVCIWSYDPPQCGALGTVYIEGDINKDCKLQIKDFALLGQDWIKCNDPNNIDCQ